MTKHDADARDPTVDSDSGPAPRNLRAVADYESVLRSLAAKWPRTLVAHELAALEAGAKALGQLREMEPPPSPVESMEATPSPCPLCGNLHAQPFECELTRMIL